MFFCKFKKVIAGLLIGFGLRNITCIIPSSNCMDMFNRNCNVNCWNKISIWKVGGEKHMKIVVKKVPKFLRGFVKFVFGIKNT